MIDEFIGMGVLLASSVVSGTVGALFGRRSTKKPSIKEKRCSGYRFGRGAICKMYDDCTALRSTDCKDGRCSYHCEDMCRCLALDPIWEPRK